MSQKQRKFKVGDKVVCKCKSYYGASCLIPNAVYVVVELTYANLGEDTGGFGQKDFTIQVSGPRHFGHEYHFAEWDFEFVSIEEQFNNFVPLV